MINAQLVEQSLKLMGNFNDGFEKKYAPLIISAIECTQQLLRTENFENDPRVIQLAAAKAYYMIACTENSDEFSSFSAGDVSFTKAKKSTDCAKNLYYSALYDCRDIIADSGFAFMGV